MLDTIENVGIFGGTACACSPDMTDHTLNLPMGHANKASTLGSIEDTRTFGGTALIFNIIDNNNNQTDFNDDGNNHHQQPISNKLLLLFSS